MYWHWHILCPPEVVAVLFSGCCPLFWGALTPPYYTVVFGDTGVSCSPRTVVDFIPEVRGQMTDDDTGSQYLISFNHVFSQVVCRTLWLPCWWLCVEAAVSTWTSWSISKKNYRPEASGAKTINGSVRNILIRSDSLQQNLLFTVTTRKPNWFCLLSVSCFYRW